MNIPGARMPLMRPKDSYAGMPLGFKRQGRGQQIVSGDPQFACQAVFQLFGRLQAMNAFDDVDDCLVWFGFDKFDDIIASDVA